MPETAACVPRFFSFSRFVTKSFKITEITLAIETGCPYNNGEVVENVKKWPKVGRFSA